jgi:hypothetical protein
MKLLVAGCSHSAGSEIIEPWHHSCYEQAYGQYLANYFEFSEYKNISGPGFSNQWIYHQLTKFLEEQSNVEEWFVVVGWTNACRLPVYCYETNSEIHLCPNQINLKHFSKPIQKAYDHLYNTMLPLQTSIELEHSRILGMQMMLKQLNVPYLFFDAVATNHDQCSTKFLDLSRYYRFGQLMDSYWNCYLTKFWDKNPRWANHAPASYHKEWARNLIQFIEENNLLDLTAK